MKKKAVVAMMLVCLLALATVVPALAYTKDVTKSPIKFSFVLSYTSYKNSAGVKLVKNASGSNVIIKNVGTQAISVNTASKNLTHIDSGRTYELSSTCKYSLANGSSSSKSAYADFTYVG